MSAAVEQPSSSSSSIVQAQQHHSHSPVRLSQTTKELLGGFAAGAANVVSGYPFDTVKVRLQSSRPGQYRGMLHCAADVVKAQGVRGLYRGLTSPLVGGALETGINYLVYMRVLTYLKGDAEQAPLHLLPVAAAASGVALSLVLAPTELLKCRMQVAGSPYRSPLHCLRLTLASEGLRGLARGLGATLAREVPGNALFFTAYEALRRSLPGRPDSSGHGSGSSSSSGHDRTLLEVAQDASSAILCGGLAGCMFWMASLPVDVVKTRIQTASPGGPWDVNMRTHFRMLYQESGSLRGLWAGLTPTLVRAFPANAAHWLAWELAMQGMGGRESS